MTADGIVSLPGNQRTQGYRSTHNYKATIYLVAGKLNAGPQLT